MTLRSGANTLAETGKRLRHDAKLVVLVFAGFVRKAGSFTHRQWPGNFFCSFQIELNCVSDQHDTKLNNTIRSFIPTRNRRQFVPLSEQGSGFMVFRDQKKKCIGKIKSACCKWKQALWWSRNMVSACFALVEADVVSPARQIPHF